MRIVNVFYELENGNIIINLVKQENGKKKIEKVISNIRPYFYIRKEDYNSFKSLMENFYTHIVNIEFVKAINGEFCKIIVDIPHNVRTIREILKQNNILTFEADIPFSRRWLIDNNIDLGDERLRFISLDIEMNNPPYRFPNEDDEILSIAVYSDDFQKVFHRDDYKSEKDLLLDFLKSILDYSVIIGWNLIDFDLKFLTIRLRKNNIDPNILKLWAWIDMLDLYKRFVTSYSKTTVVPSLKLEDVAFYELGEKKLDKSLLINRNKEEVIMYNLNDARLVWLLEKKLKLAELVENFSLVSNLLIEDCIYFSTIIEYWVMRELKGKYIFNNKGEEKEESYEGAIVFNPPSGIINNVAVFDFSSLYPNIIKAFKISIENINNDDKGEYVYPKIIDYILQLRKKYKKMYEETKNEVYNTLQIAAKFLAASFYGVLGFSSSRIYKKELAERITHYGRMLITDVANFVSSLGYRVIYGDTDSIMIQIEFEKALEMEKKINEYLLNKYNKPELNVKFEKYFEKIFFYGKKKRYFGRLIWEEGNNVDKYISRGLEIRRTDFCELVKEFQENYLKLLLEDIKKATKYYYEFINNIEKQDIKKFVFYKRITKLVEEYKSLPPHIRALLKKMNNGGYQYYVGEKIGYIVTKYKDGKILDVEFFDDSKVNNIKPDYDYYKELVREVYKRITPTNLIFNNILNYVGK